MTPATPSAATPVTESSRARRVAFSAVAVVATLLTGLLTIGSTAQLFAAGLTDDERLALVAHLPWLGLCWCLGFAAMIRGAERRPAAYQQVLGTGAGLYVTGLLLARESDPVFYVGFGVVLLLLGLLHPARARLLRPGGNGISPVLAPLSLLVAAPLALYAVDLLALHHEQGDEGAFYLGVAATAIAVPLVGLAASLRTPGWRLPAWVAGVTLAVLGAGSLLWPGGPGAMPAGWAVLAVGAGLVFGAAAEWEHRRIAADGPPRRSGGLSW